MKATSITMSTLLAAFTAAVLAQDPVIPDPVPPPLPAVGYEAGIYRSAETEPFMRTLIPEEAITCKTVETQTPPPEKVVNPTKLIWGEGTTECTALMPAWLATVPIASTAYTAKMRAYGIDASNGNQVWGTWGTAIPSFYMPTNFILQCSPTVVYESETAPATVTYPPPINVGGIEPTAVSCAPPSGYSGFPFGSTSITCAGTDYLGRASSCSMTVTVQQIMPKPPEPPPGDVLPPVISNFRAIQNGKSPNFNATATITDVIGVTRVEFLLDGMLRSTLTASNSNTWQATIKVNGPGDHIITVRARDAANNMAEAKVTIRR